MQKLMRLTNVSDLKTSSFTSRDGSSQTIEYYEVELTDGLDTIIGETSKSATFELKNHPIPLGSICNVTIRLQVIDYKRDDRASKFFKASIIEIAVI